MVAGHLSEKNGNYYAVLSYTDAFGKRRTKWVNTGLPVRGNKKKAEAFLMEERKKFQTAEPETNCQGLFNQIYKKFTSYGLHHEAYA